MNTILNIETEIMLQEIQNESELIDPHIRLQEDLNKVEFILSQSGLNQKNYKHAQKRCPDLLAKSDRLMKLIDQEFLLVKDKLWRISDWVSFRERRIIPYMESWITTLKTTLR